MDAVAATDECCKQRTAKPCGPDVQFFLWLPKMKEVLAKQGFLQFHRSESGSVGKALAPIGPISPYARAQPAPLLDDLIRASDERGWDFDTERSRRLEVYNERVLVGLLDGKVGRFRTFQNSINIMGSKPRYP